MSYTLSAFKTQLANNMGYQNPSDANFITIFPSIVDYAELRIQRDLDFLSAVSTDTTKTFTANLRSLTLPTTKAFVTIEQVNVITPFAVTNPELGSRITLTPVAKEFLDAVWNNVTGAAVPSYFAMLTDQTIIVGPWPDQAYTVEFVGKIRLPSLLATNLTASGMTFISQYLPDMLMVASMVFASGYMRNFGSQADDPKMAMSWEQQYQTLLKGAGVEEARKKFTASSWSSKSPAVAATNDRG